jgi:hypothetical protein
LLSLPGVLLAAAAAHADPIFSDRIIITDAGGKKILDVTRNDSTPSLPELAVSSGQLIVPHNQMNIPSGVILTEPNNADVISDYVKLSVISGKQNDKLIIVFKSLPEDKKRLHLPGDFPKGAPRVAETGQLQDVTADLFPMWAKAGLAPPFTVQVQSVDPPKPDKNPEPASLTLLGVGLLTAAGGVCFRRRRAG